MKSSSRSIRVCTRSMLLIALVGSTVLATAAPGDTELISIAPNGNAAGSSFVSAISADGRYVVFRSLASLFIPGAINRYNVFVRDRQSGTTELVSVNAAGVHDSVGCEPGASISSDGRYVAFACTGALVPADTNGRLDVFVRDRQAGTTQRVSVSSSGAQAAGADSFQPAISQDGRYVAFRSNSADLVAGDTNDRIDVFVRDRQAGTTQRVSVSPTGAQGNDNSEQPAISGDGRYVAFVSSATNFFPDDMTFAADVFLRDRQAGTTQLMSLDQNGNPGPLGDAPSISTSGRYVALELQQFVAVRDRLAPATEPVCVNAAGTQADAGCRLPSISGDGRLVAFVTRAANLAPDDTNGTTDIYVRDREGGTTQRISLTSDGNQGFVGNDQPFISTDGRLVAFSSADPLVANDRNAGSLGSDAMDVYIHEIGPQVVAPFTLVPGSVDLGRYAFGASSPARPLHLKNTGSASLSIQKVGLSGRNPMQFSLTSHCGDSLAVGATCDIDVALTATSLGVKTASLDVRTGSGSLSTQLRGEGARTFYAVSSTSFDFGHQAVGTRSTRRNVDIVNTGDIPLPIRGIGIGGANPGQFGFSNTCPSIVPVDDSGGGFCTLGVVFKPTSAGVKKATIVVKVAGGAGDQLISLTGTAP